VPENVTGGTLSVQTESMTFSAFGEVCWCAFKTPESFSQYYARDFSAAGIKAGIFFTVMINSITVKYKAGFVALNR